MINVSTFAVENPSRVTLIKKLSAVATSRLFGRDRPEMQNALKKFPCNSQPSHLRFFLAFFLTLLLMPGSILIAGFINEWLGASIALFCIVCLVVMLRASWAKEGMISLINTQEFALSKLAEWSGRDLENWAAIPDDDVLRIMNRLMLEVCEPVFDLQEQSAKANPLDWRPKHAELMDIVNQRFDVFKELGYMPAGGYRLFFQHIRYQRDGEPEKFILAT